MATKTARRAGRSTARRTARKTTRTASRARSGTARKARTSAGRTARRATARRAAVRIARPAIMKPAGAGIAVGRVQIVKRDGRREDFDRDKIRSGIIRAAIDTSVDSIRAREVADRVAATIERNARDGMTTAEIRDALLRELDREERRVADSFRSFREGRI
jgi:hypothetical protein